MLFRCDAVVHSCSLAYAWRALLLVLVPCILQMV